MTWYIVRQRRNKWCQPHDSEHGQPGFDFISDQEFDTEEEAQKKIDNICSETGRTCRISDWD